MAGWFTTSDRFHLPWHIKNLVLNILFDQGAVGLLLFVMLTAGTLYRLIAGAARAHPLAPFIAAALAGFLLVGLFDSLVDVPRLAFLFYLLTFVGLALPPRVSADSAGWAIGATTADSYHSSGKSHRAGETAK
jgi:O-antigen ligase